MGVAMAHVRTCAPGLCGCKAHGSSSFPSHKQGCGVTGSELQGSTFAIYEHHVRVAVELVPPHVT